MSNLRPPAHCAQRRRLDWPKPRCARRGLQRFDWRLPASVVGRVGLIAARLAPYEPPAAAVRPTVARAVAWTVVWTLGADVRDAGAPRAEPDRVRPGLPVASLPPERRPFAASARGLCRRRARRRREDARLAAERRGAPVAPLAARAPHAARRCAGQERGRQGPRAEREPRAAQALGAVLAPDVRQAGRRRAALPPPTWRTCRRQGEQAPRCVCSSAT